MGNSGGNPAQNAYLLTVNLFNGTTLGFQGVRVIALDRASMLTGGAANAIAFNITPAGVGDSYSLVPAGSAPADPPPAGRDEFLISVDSPASGGVTLTQVHGWKFHVDFGTPGNSTLGLGANHTPNANVTVTGFVDAYTNSGTLPVPENGTTQKLDTLGDKIMTPLVYQNSVRHGIAVGVPDSYPELPERPDCDSLVSNGMLLAAIFPLRRCNSRNWIKEGDGSWRWMPSIAVDQNGNMARGYSTSSTTQQPSICYAGRLASDPLSSLGQGEVIMTTGGGHQTHSSGRWGDYSMLTIDPADGLKLLAHQPNIILSLASASWFTRIGKFQFPAGPTPTANTMDTTTPTAKNTVTPTATPTQKCEKKTVKITVRPTATQTGTPTATPTKPTATPKKHRQQHRRRQQHQHRTANADSYANCYPDSHTNSYAYLYSN